jgi:hypothetical protein
VIPDQAWTAEWRACLLDRAWRRLEAYQGARPGNVYYTVLRQLVGHPDEDSKALAAQVAAITGRPLEADAFRQQVRRARRRLARLLVVEVAQTLDQPTSAQIEEELADLGLMEYVRDFLPPDSPQRS